MGVTTPPQQETLLFIDDEPLLTDMFRQFMTKRGYRVLTAATGQEALSIVSVEAGAIQIVLTDMSMPDMTGLEVANHLYQQWPDLPVMIVTGHDPDEAQATAPPNVVGVIQKPCPPREFETRIRAALDK